MSDKLKYFGLFLFASLFCALAYPVGNASSSEIKWYSYEDGLAMHKKQDKKIFLTFYADWCGYCKVMDKETFKNADVIGALNENFISIKINSDKDRKTARSFRVRGLPDSWFLDEKSEVIGHRKGYIDPDTMIKLLKFIQTDSYKEMSYKKFMENQ